MNKVFLGLIIAVGAYIGICYAEDLSKYPCNSSSTAKQCQDRINIDNLELQSGPAAQAVQSIQNQIYTSTAALQTQLSQAAQAANNIQLEIYSNEQDYNQEGWTADQVASTAVLANISAKVGG